MNWRIIGRHRNWVIGATITESYLINDSRFRRFTATIRGYQNWKIYEGLLYSKTLENIITCVRSIQERIDSGDNSIFYEHQVVPSLTLDK